MNYLLLATAFVSILHSSLASTDDVLLQFEAMPLDVAGIVAAISNVQRNVTLNPRVVANVKVATSTASPVDTKETKTEGDGVYNAGGSYTGALLELALSSNVEIKNITNTVSSTSSTKPIKETVEKAEEEYVDVEEETTTTAPTTDAPLLNTSLTTPDPLNLPNIGIFSGEGLTRWSSWLTAMRDPELHPEGVEWWPTILSTGTQRLMSIYNPFRNIGARALQASRSANDLLLVYQHREALLDALDQRMVGTDLDSILEYTRALEEDKFALKVGDIIVGGDNRTVAAGGVGGAGVPGLLPNAPFDVNLVNFALKSFYVLAILAYLPFSGIENFFTAPLPPEMDSLSGQLRFFGLQALLGPDYVVDYDPTEEEIAAEYEDDYEYEYEDVRRADKTSPKRKYKKNHSKKKLKKTAGNEPAKTTTYYNTVNSAIRAPPSHYGESSSFHRRADSSYSSYRNERR